MNSDLLNAILDTEMNFETHQNSFSPLYSNFGLGLEKNFSGIRSLYLHYNRKTNTLWEPLLSFEGQVGEYIPQAHKTIIKTDSTLCEITFYDRDCVLVSCKTDKPVSIFSKIGNIPQPWVVEKSENTLILQGYSLNGDDRDPDREVPVSVGASIIKGNFSENNGQYFVKPIDGEILLAFAFDAMSISTEKTKALLENAPKTFEKATENNIQWIMETIRTLDTELTDDKSATVFVKAIISLIFNLAKAWGNLDGCISSFPNRGGYPTHFMWDSCFQNLAYEIMNIDIAKDSLLQLCNNIRPDGKIPQFLCSTWARPHDAQPALLGWAAKRLYNKDGDIEFIKKLFPALEKNNNWWLTARMTKFGIIKCADGLETGQDNSPRFDNGTILALDMNAYLLNQIKVTSEFAEILGYEDKALYWKEQADILDNGMVKYLYDEEKNMFFDADAQSGEKQALLTTSAFIPLWAGVTLPKGKAEAMIKDWLLNPQSFYGAVPFPSVAYTEGVYDPYDWWRGPTWMPEAWLMLEVLLNYGFKKEYEESAVRLYEILLQDGVLHELFNSQTGEGMGNPQQGWTAAIFIKLHDILNK